MNGSMMCAEHLKAQKIVWLYQTVSHIITKSASEFARELLRYLPIGTGRDD